MDITKTIEKCMDETILPADMKWLEIGKQRVFPTYAASGFPAAEMVCILIKGSPMVLDGYGFNVKNEPQVEPPGNGYFMVVLPLSISTGEIVPRMIFAITQLQTATEAVNA